ncbi:FxSxx-COOH system tetratricopeptide repeat protein [Streptomyces collinus]|uniref:FxSxx-COOH system tetratricopeptide repeat protein n=1 Tax=Streptomyces collinus TaxID=42684 RepID=UPI0033AB7368
MAISGDNARVVALPPDAVHWARQVQAPPGSRNLPGAADEVFVGREPDLRRVRGLLSAAKAGEDAPGGVVVTQTGAVHGLGGVGKSTLALHYAHRFRADYSLVWWITADTPEGIVAGLAALALRLCPQWAGTAGADAQAAWAITWLGWHAGWLLIFDNVEDPAHLHPYLGTLTGGHLLATSRKSTGWHKIGSAMPLGLLTPQAAADLLCRLAFDGRAPTDEERRQAEALAQDLGFLPLALEQAGAYAYETGTELGEYRQSLDLMLGETGSDANPERTIARIWDHTLTTVENRDPLAATLLYAMAWLAPDDIPRTLLAPLAQDAITLGRALGVLHAYNMVTFTSQQGVSVHRLVQTVLRTYGTDDTATPRGRHEAEQAVHQALPPQPDAKAAQDGPWERVLPHVMALLESTPPGHSTSSDARDTYYAAAQHLFHQGRDGQTIALRKAILAQEVRVLGDIHPDTLVTRHNLAHAYGAAGDLERAIPLFETTLTQKLQVRGETHPGTLITRNQLAAAYQAAGDLERAIPLYETTLTQQVQVLGETHPSTLITRNNLAHAYHAAEDLERAIPLFETTLTQQVQVLGETHPYTLITRNNLAHAYRATGDLERAIPLYETTLTQKVQVLGETHPSTLITRHHLAAAYQAAEDLERAIPLHETTLTQQVQVLGDTHPDTLIARHHLAAAYQAAGDLERAIPLFETTLTQQVQVRGETHPSTLITRHNLAAAYQAAGDLERAIALYETTLTQQVQVLGETHRDTVITRNNLALASAVQQRSTATSVTEYVRQPSSATD